MARSNTITSKTSLDFACKNFLSSKVFHNFESLTESSYEKIDEVKNKFNKIIGENREKNLELYAFQLIENFRHLNGILNDEERIFLFIQMVDPECLTYKYYLNYSIPDIREYERAYNLATDKFMKKQTKMHYEEKLKEKNNIIYELRTKLIEKLGIFIPSIIKYEKMYLRIHKEEQLASSIKKNSLKQLSNILNSLEFISPLDESEIDRLNVEIEEYKTKFPTLDINLLLYHIFNQSSVLKLKNISEQFFFLLNTINRYYSEDQNLSHIVDYNGTWDNMNEELEETYGIKSEPLLRLQSCYNKIYNIKGDF